MTQSRNSTAPIPDDVPEDVAATPLLMLTLVRSKSVGSTLMGAAGGLFFTAGEVGGVLLLQQVQQVGGRTNAQQSPNGVEDHIDSALRRHGEESSGATDAKRFSVTRSVAISGLKNPRPRPSSL